jgi:ATP-binding protein involved in chromosome partitioning
MSHFIGADGLKYDIFRHAGSLGGRKLAAEAGVPFLGEIAIDPKVAECGDLGDPVVHKYPDSPIAKTYLELAETVARAVTSGGAPSALPGLVL